MEKTKYMIDEEEPSRLLKKGFNQTDLFLHYISITLSLIDYQNFIKTRVLMNLIQLLHL